MVKFRMFALKKNCKLVGANWLVTKTVSILNFTFCQHFHSRRSAILTKFSGFMRDRSRLPIPLPERSESNGHTTAQVLFTVTESQHVCGRSLQQRQPLTINNVHIYEFCFKVVRSVQHYD